jgi:DNA ligase-1
MRPQVRVHPFQQLSGSEFACQTVSELIQPSGITNVMHGLAQVAEAIAATSRKTEKVRRLANYLRSVPVDEAAISAVFLSGRAFPAWEETTLQVGGAQLWRAVSTISGKSDAAMTAAYRKHGDAGASAYDVLLSAAPIKSALSLLDVERALREIARASGPAAKTALLADLLRRATALEAKYIVKIIGRELRIGLKESLVEEAIAQAYAVTAAEVQRANMLLGDIGETLRLAASHRLNEARMRLFHPLGFMLASPAEDAAEAFSYFDHAQVEDKYDGIRAQAHCGKNPPYVRLFSRTLDDVSESFPELMSPLRSFTDEVILDGEILAWNATDARALPFAELQKRLGRKKVTRTMMEQVPVAYVVFDVLYAGGDLVLDQPLDRRNEILNRVFAAAQNAVAVEATDVQGQLAFEPAVETPAQPTTPVLRAPVLRADSAPHLDELFEAARTRGNEGLMVKDIQSPYTPGRRGKSWLKLKRELATLDVVVTAVEWGHGKRIKVLSDYTFAVQDPNSPPSADGPRTPSGARLLNVGKAYSGLTDAEIAELTQWFLSHTIADEGFLRRVEPKVVLEVAFNAVMKSGRHESGFALRFPRILRVRTDKSPDEIDTLDRVREIWESQKWPEVAPAQSG